MDKELTKKIVLSIISGCVLSGCVADGGFNDLDLFMEEVRNKPRGTIEPLPEFQVYQAFSYSSAARRAPFSPPIDISLVVQVEKSAESKVVPDFDRPRELLENFGLTDLKMMGTLQKAGDSTLWALIGDNEGGIHRISNGQYMGKNHGRVVVVEDGVVNLLEIVPDGQGGWIERPRTLSLEDH